MTLDISKELFAEIFSYLAKNGKGIEINTSAWWDDPCWGEDVLKLYRDLGGQYITTGSDAHRSDRVAKRIKEAEKLGSGGRHSADCDVPKNETDIPPARKHLMRMHLIARMPVWAAFVNGRD